MNEVLSILPVVSHSGAISFVVMVDADLAATQAQVMYNRELHQNAIDAVNDFTRARMREDGFYRRIMPPTELR